MKKYLDVNGVTSLYKIIMGKVDDMLNEKLQLLLTPSTRPLTFEVLEDGTFSFITDGTPVGSVSYSLDYGTTWNALNYGGSTPTVTAGSKVLWKGDYKAIDGDVNFGMFSSTGKFNVSGNIMSLMYGDDFVDKTDLTESNYCFYGLFTDCSNIIDASDLVLPATTLVSGCYNSMFQGCTSLTTAPALPAKILAEGCYSGMFWECTSLTTAPELPATTLAEECYSSMFNGCTSLTSAPKLPATNLANGCYGSMFDGCTSLTTAHALPAKILAVSCYNSMFSGCTSLTTTPELPAKILADHCYSYMFGGCSSLTTAPELPATTLAESCYGFMFRDCRSLTTAPELPAMTLANFCYEYMFQNCSKLNHIKALFTTTPSSTYTSNWVSGVSSTGTFVKNAAATWDVTGTSGVPTGWTVETVYDPNIQYFTFEALENGTFSFITEGTPTGSVSYSLDSGTTWTALSAGSSTPTIQAGSKVLWKGNYKGTDYSNYGSFSSTGKFNVSGNIMSLTYGDNFVDKTDLTGSNYCFRGLFMNCSNLIDASNLVLPAMTLVDGCYDSMFSGCTSLTVAPELPATTLVYQCYQHIFQNCTSLKTTPELPATTLASWCYGYMFSGCTSLTAAPALPATTLTTSCYNSMFQGCTSLTTAPALPATTLTMFCYKSMFSDCSSLTTAPALPATTLVAYCYGAMFQNCSKLNYIKALFTTTPGTSWTANWVSGVSSTGTFVKNSKATWDVTGPSGIPTGWTVETATA